MDLNIYDVIKTIMVTEKSTHLYNSFGQITFEVHKLANKGVIKDAIEKIWSVKVNSVHVVKIPGKSKTFGRKKFTTPNRKKAIISLKKGYKIDLSGHFETMGGGTTSNANPKEAEMKEK